MPGQVRRWEISSPCTAEQHLQATLAGLLCMPVIHNALLMVQVGLLDIDICGPSIPKMLGLEGEEIHQSNAGWSPVYVEENLGVMSIGESYCLLCFCSSSAVF